MTGSGFPCSEFPSKEDQTPGVPIEDVEVTVCANRSDENLRLGSHYRPWQPRTCFKFPRDKNRFARATLSRIFQRPAAGQLRLAVQPARSVPARVDQENHTKGDFLRWGVRCGRNFSWTSAPEWGKENRGREHHCDSRVLEDVTR